MTTAPVVTVTDELIAELEQLAGKATPGPWVLDFEGGSLYICEQEDDDKAIAVALPYDKGLSGEWDGGIKTDANWQYIAAANPATILALLAERAELKRVIADVKWRVSDTTDQLQATGFDGDRRYGLDEWSVPIKNLKMAIGILEKAVEPQK